MKRPVLSEDRVDLWIVDVPPVSVADVLPRIEGRLSEEEIEAAGRFVSDRHRLVYAVSHAALRSLLALYLERPPRELEFDRGEHGRPELRNRSLRFNLSHTDGIAAIAITSRFDVGVDVERTSRRGDFGRLARAVMTSEELDEFGGTAEEFFRLWTLKEAYAKARGGGLTLGFRNFGFRTDPEPRLFCHSDFDDGTQWRFTSCAPRPETRLSAAVRSSRDLSWRVSDVMVEDLLGLQ